MKLKMNKENVLGRKHTFASLGKCKETRPKHSWGPMGVSNLWDKSASNKHDSNILLNVF
jgi:hypothetical protein